MSAPQKFRSALNGFNREDVASYLEYLNSKHTAQVNQLTSEADFLRSKLESSTPAADFSEDLTSLEQERDALKLQIAALQAENEQLLAHASALAEENEVLRTRCAELEQKASSPKTAVPPFAPTAPAAYTPAEELEIYRRAERAERMARERADLVYRQTNGILNEASIRVNEMADQVVPIADQILMQITQLQNAVNSTKQSLQDAVVIINTLRPDGN